MAGDVVLLTGPPGAGKTTVAKLLAASADRSVHLEADLFFRAIRSGYIEPGEEAAHPQNVAVMGIFARAGSAYAEAGYLTILEGMMIPGWFFEDMLETMRSGGLHVIYVVLRPTVEACVERASSRERGEPLDPAIVRRLWEGFRDIEPTDPHLIDGDAPASVVAEVIAERRERGVLSG